MRLYFYLLLTSSLLINCKGKSDVSFYHWKRNAVYGNQVSEALNHTRVGNTVYMHYFDVDVTAKGVYPVYALQDVDGSFKSQDIVPVVFITNRALKDDVDIPELSNKIVSLTHEISEFHFHQSFKTIQVDCDWTESTKNTYFELLSSLNKYFDVVPTIRLHQIKYPQKTGVPPVKKGVLMLYNVGDLKNENQNSILQADIVSQYIDGDTQYPLQLDVALPLFSQTVIKNNKGQIRLINRTTPELLKNDTKHFKQLSKTLYQVNQDTLYNGFYLSPGYTLKMEESHIDEIIKSYHIVKDSQLETDNVILYHLDETVLDQIDWKTLLNKL